MPLFWKETLPGWYAYESWEYEYEGDLEEGGGGDDDDDEEEDEEDEEDEDEDWDEGGIEWDEEETDGDGGQDFFSGDEEDFSEDFFEEEREEREEEQQRDRFEEEQRRAQEEAERQRRIAEQQRQIEENRRRMEEEQRRQMEDMDGDGQVTLTEQVQAEGGGGFTDAVNEPLREQFQEYVQETQEEFDQAHGFNSPEETNRWVRERQAEVPIEPGREYSPRGSFPGTDRGAPIATVGPAYQPASLMEEPSKPDVSELAATTAARAVAESGGTPQQVAQTAYEAAVMAAAAREPRQTLGQQSAWTRAAFRSTYGEQAEAEWQRQHENELRRNYYLYGSAEPRAGTPAKIEGLAAAPDRRIGRIPPPGAMEDARYGVAPTARPAANAAPSQAARIVPPGANTPAAVGPVAEPPPAPFVPQPPRTTLVPGGNEEPGKYSPPVVGPRVPISAPSSLRPSTPTGPGFSAPPVRDDYSREGPGYSAPPVRDDYSREVRGFEQGITPPSLPSPGPGVPDLPAQSGPIQQAREIEIPAGATFTPIRNIVGYDPVTGQTFERGYERENYASTDTSVSPYPATPRPQDDPVFLAIDNPRPIDALASLAAASKDPDLPRTNDAVHIAHGIAAMLRGDRGPDGQYVTWAEPYLNDVARMAWAREERTNGRGMSDPRNTPIEYIEKWKDAFYGSDHTVPLVKELDQQMIDYAAARTPPGKPFRWQDAYGPNGDRGLIEAQATDVDCGPSAFSSILRSRGYNVSPRDTFPYAIKYRYHSGPGGEFAGPDAMVDLLKNHAGLDARKIGVDLKGTGWNEIDKELAEGRPVMLSSRGHWWTVSAKNDRGEYYVGGSALKGNPSWMPRGAFRYGSDVNAAILTRGDVDPNSRAVRELGLKPPVTGPRNTRPLLSGQTEFEPAPGRSAQGSAGERMGIRLMNQWQGEGQEEAPGSYTGTRPVPPDISWFPDANPNAGLYAGEGRGRDVGAKVWNTAFDMSGDARFATLIGGLVNGEGGFSGQQDEVGATGIFQFDPRYAEGKEFTKWLRAQGIQEDPQRAARNIEHAMGYYLPYLKDAYDGAVARGVTDENALLTAIVKNPSRRGYGHNSGSSGANLQNYLKGLQEFKRGEFRLLPRSRW